MRKIFIAVMLIGLIVIGCAAWGTDLRVGLKAGVDLGFIGGRDFLADLNELDDSDDARTESKWGFSGGVYFIIGLSEILSVQSEVLHSMFGGNFFYTSSGQDVTGRQIAHVLEVPILLRAQMPLASGTLFGFAGPNVIFFLSDIITRQESDSDSDVSTQAPASPAVLGLSVGLGYEFPIGSALLSIDLRATATVAEIFRQSDYRLNAMYLMVGCGWPL